MMKRKKYFLEFSKRNGCVWGAAKVVVLYVWTILLVGIYAPVMLLVILRLALIQGSPNLFSQEPDSSCIN